MRKIKENAGALKFFKILFLLALPVGIYLAFMGGNQNLYGGMEEKENLIHIHTDEIFQTTEGENTIESVIEALAEMEAEQFGAREGLAEETEEAKVVQETKEFPVMEMPGHEKIALSSRMAAAQEKTAAPQEKTAAPESTVNEALVSEAPEKESTPEENTPYLNQYVLDIIKTYQIGKGSYPYLLNNDYLNYNGVTSTLSYKGKVLLRAHPSGSRASHCVGITFEVFFKAMQERNRQLGISPENFNGMSWDNLFDLGLYWFVASGSKSTNNIVLAVEKYGIGKGIHRLEDARPGDFIDFNRVNGTGHTVVFLNWIKDGDRIIGFRYWSSQGSTGGINYNEEYFNLPGKKGNVIMNPIYIVRILPVSQYRNF
ncbi:MAG: hypothetical protein Q7J85_11355 [Bacillota bacterium]|nr:hypothetical protein [Bacillota bacterium]